MKKKNYYKQVEDYYNEDAVDFDQRYWENPVLQFIRQDFREEVKRHTFKNMLEIGYGTGLDLVHFSKTHPGVKVAGVDISSGMHQIATQRIRRENLKNVFAAKGSIEEVATLFPGEKFDLIYVFFGALNTVDDLESAAKTLREISSPGGVLVLSFVNKYYLAGFILELLKGKFASAFSRLRPEWGGYSPTKFLPSRCYRPGEIRKYFSEFQLIKRRGYSIIHPAWYYRKLYNLLGRMNRFTWKADRLLNKTPLWRFGEYFMFVFQNPDNID